MTITYRKNSDIYLPYGKYELLRPSDKRPNAFINYAANKTKQVAWFVGNCKLMRSDLAYRLDDYDVIINVAGRCVTNFYNHLKCDGCEDEMRKHKFYFAAENAVCSDYITEKYWRLPFHYDLVPIVFGGGNYSDPNLAIPGSFIDASKFKSVKDLADYIKEVDNNDTLYNGFFQWKQKYKLWKPQFGHWPYPCYFLCELCHILNDKNNKIKFYDLSSFWDVKHCRKRENFSDWFDS